MKRFLAIAIASWMTIGAMAQTNLQVFYDFGKDRKQITTTFEMFKQDKWGDTFFFIDHDFKTRTKDGADDAPSGTYGVNYFMHSADFKNTLTLEVLNKNIAHGKSDLPMQFTAVWGMNDLFGVEGLTISGFADFWWEDHVGFKDDGSAVAKSTTFISEPQIWYNVGRHFGVENLNIGGEVELSNDFGTYDGFKCNPCLGVKWNF